MIQPRCDLDLPKEPIGSQCSREIRMQDFQRHEPLVLLVLRQVDGSHAALPQLTVDRIRLRECGSNSFYGRAGLCHR